MFQDSLLPLQFEGGILVKTSSLSDYKIHNLTYLYVNEIHTTVVVGEGRFLTPQVKKMLLCCIRERWMYVAK